MDSKYLTDRISSVEREKERFSEENEKLNLICHQLYGELEDMKRKLSEVDFTATDKYHVERSRNTELQMELDTWRARYAASEKSRSKEIEDLRMTMDSQRKSMIDRDMR
jgi:predicted ribosome quality control (RQC) complex YloA/Tae2 family protein